MNLFKEKYNALNFCLKIYGLIILFGPLLFLLLFSDNEHLGRNKAGIMVDRYTMAVVQGAIASMPMLLIYILVSSHLNLKIKDSKIYKGLLSVMGLFLVLLLYSLPLRLFYEGIILKDDLKMMYCILAVLIPFMVKREIYKS